jgi:hypothetical protein
MQTLFIPDIIKFSLLNKQGNPLRQGNILIGIQTFATHKNNIDISPFLSDKNGQFIITKDRVMERADIFIDYGIMDYGSLESARPDIKIYYWGNQSLDRYINYWRMLLKKKKTRVKTEMEIKLLGHMEQRFAEITKRETEDLKIYSNCFNRETKFSDDIILVSDNWDGPEKEKVYTATLPV